MAVYYVDSSALAKRYVAETGSAWVTNLLDPATGNEIYIVRITTVEVISALARRSRGGSILPADALLPARLFRDDLIHDYDILETTDLLLNAAMTLAETYGLRGYDAIPLAAAVEIHTRCVAGRLPAVTLISSDGDLNSNAVAKGMFVADPNDH